MQPTFLINHKQQFEQETLMKNTISWGTKWTFNY